MPVSTESIRLRRVRQNNLKGFDLDIPLGRLTVVTGLSGSGKSSLVFETLHAEGQRRYVETFSAYTRQFLEMLDRPEVDRIENIHPSIAIQQTNSVKTSRSTVGTMTELNDFFKVWFAHAATLHDPANGQPIRDDTPESTADALIGRKSETLLVTFPISRPPNLSWSEILEPLQKQGYLRTIVDRRVERIHNLDTSSLGDSPLNIIQDRIPQPARNRSRLREAIETAFHYGQGRITVFDESGAPVATFSRGLTSPVTGRRFRPASPALFSFNSPIGACPTCRGFGRIISIDPQLVIPDPRLSINQGAIRAFQGKVYSECLRDIRRHAVEAGVDLHKPWEDLSEEEKTWVWKGDPDYPEDVRDDVWMQHWYGIDRFFKWLERNTYKMHVRVFLSKFRAYHTCPTCGGSRLRDESLCWQWEGYRIPDLFEMPIDQLLETVSAPSAAASLPPPAIAAHEALLSRLQFLDTVGLGYLSLNRPSRTLSGGETQRVNLTSCLGASVVDTCFVLDEPSIGLHPRDVHRVVSVLRALVHQGNTVVVVEHDEAVIRAADHLIEIGPEPGEAGGQVTFEGTPAQILRSRLSRTGPWLSGKKSPPTPPATATPRGSLQIEGATHHNLRDLSLQIPLGNLVGIAGVSGSGKSTLLHNVIFEGLRRQRGEPADNPASVQNIRIDGPIGPIERVDQSTVAKTPRSNPAIYIGAWDGIRKTLAATDSARASGLDPSHFSFNSGDGRCPNCEGLGAIKTEMQFLSDIYTPCPVCGGRRFREEVLAVEWKGHTVDDILRMDVRHALVLFADQPAIVRKLEALAAVGLDYLRLGQPLNTLSGGESQRLKLVRYLTGLDKDAQNALLLLDEPTTGLHRDDVGRLIEVLRRLVEQGHSVLVIEHHTDVLNACDWLVEIGPEAGTGGGKLVAEGTPATVALGESLTAPYLRETAPWLPSSEVLPFPTGSTLLAAEPPSTTGYKSPRRRKPDPHLRIEGAREHNLRNVSTKIKHGSLTVITGVSGSGKSSLAFDTIFAEGQRRFLESMSPYARQFIEQMPRADCDRITGIAPTISIEQRLTRGTSKSTVGTITEVAQLLRLLFARLATPVNPHTGNRATASTAPAIVRDLRHRLQTPPLRAAKFLYLTAPVIRGRKGHHQPLADWAASKGYPFLICDGLLVETDKFERLRRYREHDVDIVVADLAAVPDGDLEPIIETTLRLGKGTGYIRLPDGSVPFRFSLRAMDPETGEALPVLDPKDFSWNSERGWCPRCRGSGLIFPDDEDASVSEGTVCPECGGSRLNPVARHAVLDLKAGGEITLPELLAMTPHRLIESLHSVQTDRRGNEILRAILPEVEERLAFMQQVGLDYLTLDRATRTLSGGEAQRIRLAAQLGSNLSGVLYVLDEPSIGLHARDNERLITSLESLRARGNTILVVEHDDAIMRRADHIIDMGPGAGVHGGEIVAEGPPSKILRSQGSITGQLLAEGIPHPLRGTYRPAPPTWNPRSSAARDAWIVLHEPTLRNLKGGTLTVPLGRLSVVCGVSGAGKSTLIRDCLAPALKAADGQPNVRGKDLARRTGQHLGSPRFPVLQSIRGAHLLRRVIEVDQSPIGKTSRSTPATFIGIFDLIRQHFASLPESKQRGFDASRFSFNTAGGRCETCKGTGRVKLEMNFLPDAEVPCEDCEGRRYGPDLLEIRWRDHSIADVLELTFEEAVAFFDFNTRIRSVCELMVETGLGYIRLGQTSPTLSGGEAQRLKLVSELAGTLNPDTGKPRPGSRTLPNLYILEEPSIGLHLSDVRRLLDLLHRLVDTGQTIIVIEHHLDIIREADHLIEIGPEGGDAGGSILYQGPVANLDNTPTTPFLPNLKST